MGELLWGLRGGAGRWHSGIFGNTWEQELHWIFKDRKSSISITFIFCGGNRAPSGIHFCWCKGRQLTAITKRPIAQLGLGSGYIHLLLDQIKLNVKQSDVFYASTVTSCSGPHWLSLQAPDKGHFCTCLIVLQSSDPASLFTMFSLKFKIISTSVHYI